VFLGRLVCSLIVGFECRVHVDVGEQEIAFELIGAFGVVARLPLDEELAASALFKVGVVSIEDNVKVGGCGCLFFEVCLWYFLVVVKEDFEDAIDLTKGGIKVVSVAAFVL